MNFSWLLLAPLITSAKVLMVSVSTSAGIPLAEIQLCETSEGESVNANLTILQ